MLNNPHQQRGAAQGRVGKLQHLRLALRAASTAQNQHSAAHKKHYKAQAITPESQPMPCVIPRNLEVGKISTAHPCPGVIHWHSWRRHFLSWFNHSFGHKILVHRPRERIHSVTLVQGDPSNVTLKPHNHLKMLSLSRNIFPIRPESVP